MTILIFVLSTVLVATLILFGLTRYQDKALMNRFPPVGHFTQVSGGNIHWTVSGSGPSLVLVHGLAGNIHNFRALETQLAKSFTVYCLDRPGSGHSHRAFATSPDFSNQAKMLLEWMDKEAISDAIFVGHSMGGAISLNLALQASSRVRGLALISPLVAPLNIKPSKSMKFVMRSRLLRLLIAKTLAFVFNKRHGRRQVNAIFKPEPVNAEFGTEFGGALALYSRAFLAASGDLSVAQMNLREQIKHYHEIKCPVSVLYGDGDRILSCEHQTTAMQQALKSVDIRVLPKRGHMLPITAVEECLEMIKTVHLLNEKRLAG